LIARYLSGGRRSRWPALALLLLLALARPAAAAAPGPAAAPSAAELQTLVDTLQNDNARAALVGQLQALIAAQRKAAPPQPAAPRDFVAELSHRLNAFAEEVLAGVAVILDAPHVVAWAQYQITDKAARLRWGEVLFACAVVFGLAFAAEWAVRRGVAGLARRLSPPQNGARALRLSFAAIGLALAMLPVAAYAGAALVAMAIVLPPYSLGREAIALLVEATIAARLVLAAAKAVLVPGPAWPRFVPAGEETRNYLLIWARRFTWWTAFGYAVAGAAWWLGIPGADYALMLKLVGFGLAILGIVFVLQNREAVGRWIAGRAAAEPGGWARLRRHFAETWHVLAIFYIGAVYLAYSLHDEGGSAFVLRSTALSLVAIVAARLLVRAVARLSERGFAIAPDLKARLPLLEARANRYLPVVIGIASAAVYAVTALVILQAWGLGAFGWFATGFGRRVGGALLSSALVLAAALLFWEILAAAIERSLAALDHNGAPARTRRRTLLPLLRTTMLIVIVVIAALVILSQIGLDIAPLLAGAGVVGVAIGFGSQALIKDIITGIFILIEDQIAVGDIVDVGKEHAGVVEAISIRTIRLRDLGGVVHTVPFSEVTTVKNQTRDFAFAVARVTIAYGEDIDRVVEILRGVCDELASDPEFAPLILDRFDYQGVDALNEFSVVLLLRVRTLPGKQFVVGRALNRLIKIALEKHGVASRDPAPVILSGPIAGASDAA
jgi:moderate conductance mechanosensitive channel